MNPLKKKLDRNYKRIACCPEQILEASQHKTADDKLVSDVIMWIPVRGHTSDC